MAGEKPYIASTTQIIMDPRFVSSISETPPVMPVQRHERKSPSSPSLRGHGSKIQPFTHSPIFALLQSPSKPGYPEGVTKQGFALPSILTMVQ